MGLVAVALMFLLFSAVGVICLVWPQRVRDWTLHPFFRPDDPSKSSWTNFRYPLSREFHIWSLRFAGVIALAGAAFVAAVLADVLL